MILVTPFVEGLTEYANYAAAVRKRGLLGSHVHVVLSTFEHEDWAIEFEESLADIFMRSTRSVVEPGPGMPGPTGLANAFLREALKAGDGYEDVPGEPAGVPILYNDPNWRPSRTGWLDAVQAEFYAKRTPACMGRIREQDGVRSVWGPAVFSRGYAEASGLIPFLGGTNHWRSYLIDEFERGREKAECIGTGAGAVIKPFKPNKKK